jgi:hypothetical protein
MTDEPEELSPFMADVKWGPGNWVYHACPSSGGRMVRQHVRAACCDSTSFIATARLTAEGADR